MMRHYGPMLLAPAAVLFQVFPGLFLYIVPGLAYGSAHGLVETQVWKGSIAVLAFFAVSGLALVSTASYLLLTRCRSIVAWPMILFFCVPAWLLSSFYLHAVFVFLAWV